MWRLRLLILLLFSIFCGDVPLSWASAKDCGGHAEKGQIGMSASYAIHGDTTTVTINWEGFSEDNMLVVSLDSRSERNTRAFLVAPLATKIFGLVLARSAGVSGSATFSYKRSEWLKYMKDPELVLTVYLTYLIDIVYKPLDVSVEREGSVEGYTELTSADCSDEFQILCQKSDSGVEKVFFSNLRMFQGTAGRRCGVSVPWAGGEGHLYLDIAQ